MLKEVMTEGFILFLFILLTLSMGIIFQFFLYKLRELNKVQKRIIDSLHFVHDSQKKSTISSQARANKVLRGNLSLEYRGSRADTRATFILDKDSSGQ